MCQCGDFALCSGELPLIEVLMILSSSLLPASTLFLHCLSLQGHGIVRSLPSDAQSL